MKSAKLIALIVISAGLGALFYQTTRTFSNETGAPPARQFAVDDNMLGKRRPEFSLPDLDDTPRMITAWDNHIILINFWASWCPPCIKEMPMLNNVYNTYRTKRFVVLGIAIEPADDARKFLQSSPVEYPVLYGESGAERISRDYGNNSGSIPFSALINADGIIVKQYYGEIQLEQLESDLAALF